MDRTEEYGFFAMLDRMQYIGRWALMRNSRIENIKEHSFDVAVIAHCLTVIHNKNEKRGCRSQKASSRPRSGCNSG